MMNNRAKSNAHPTLKLSNALKEQEQFLQKAVRRFRENPASEFQTSAAQWLLDNLYVVQQTQRQIREDMPPGFYRRLPTIVGGPLQGHLRIYRIARQLVVDNGGLLNADGIEHTAQAVRSYTGNPQTDAGPTILTIGELWALPVMLRLCILQCLTQSACRITGTVYEGSLPPIPLPPELKDDQVVANAILSLRALAIEDWQSFFENVSQVEHILRSDPAQAYAAMDTDTRNRYRKVIEQLARATGKDEPDIACQAVALAQGAFDAGAKAAGAESPRLAHVGYYLIDEGRLLLEAQLNYPAPLQVRIRRWARHHPTSVYLGGITLISLIVLLAVLDMAAQAGATPLQLIIAGLLSVVPAASIAVGLTNWMVTLALPPRVLPKMDFAKGIPAEYQTLVVVPALLSSAAEVNSLLKQIELHYLRNPDPYLSFALLTDFPDAPQQHLPGDDALIEQAANGIRRLNRKYVRERATPFYVLNRERRWNANEARWMGWGKETREITGTQPPVAPRHRHLLHRADWRPERITCHQVRHHPGRRYPSAAPGRTTAGGDTRTPPEPGRVQRGRPGHGRLHTVAATHRNYAGQRRPFAFSPASSPATLGWISIPTPFRTSTRICSERASTSAKGFTTWTPSSAA